MDEAYFDTQRPAMVKLSMSTETGVSGFRTHRHQRCVVLEANGLVMERNKRGGDKFHPPGIFQFSSKLIFTTNDETISHSKQIQQMNGENN